MPEHRTNLPIGRWAIEFTLLLVSVYLAIFLEGVSQDRSEAAAARQALAQLAGEIQEDRDEIVSIVGVQDELGRNYRNLIRWLANPRSAPSDSIGAAFYVLAAENPTLFARRASWNTMISAGQFRALDDPELVLRLGQLYETVYARIDYNSEFYDGEITSLLRSTDVIQWSSLESDPLREDSEGIAHLRDELARVHTTWNTWYRDLLEGFLPEVDAALAAVRAHLVEHGA